MYGLSAAATASDMSGQELVVAAPPPAGERSERAAPALDSLPYLDGPPSAENLAAARTLIAAAALELPRAPSAYLDTTPLPASTLPENGGGPPPPAPALLSELESATARAATASETSARGALSLRFGGAAWRERCARADAALVGARADVADAQKRFERVNRRRRRAQLGVAGRVEKLRREYFRVARENRALAAEIARRKAR